MNGLLDVQSLLHSFGRGGGGGSGGGSGGGGGIIVVLGYLPTHFVGYFLQKKLKNPIGFVLMVIFTLAYGVLWWLLGSIGFIISIAAFVGGPAGYFGWFGAISSRIRKKAQKNLAAAAATDPAWDKATLDARVKDVFYNYQQDWSTFNTERIKQYCTPAYDYYTELMLAAIKLRGRRNQMDNVELIEWFPTEVDDLPDNTADRVVYYVHAKASDKLIETVDGQDRQLFDDKSDFSEYWTFVRSNNTWLLDSISQLTENSLMIKQSIKDFAAAHNMSYSPDWGWLLLPNRGQLFKNGKFGTSDINNHVIGIYNNLLVELYSFLPSRNSTQPTQYVIAQVALPKRYDSLVVEAKGSAITNVFKRTPRGYNKVTLEWPDFNKRYNVYATNVEQVTAFELLHPVYMEKLFALPFKVSIEVVENVVYLYSLDKKADYVTMFSLLQDAFKEMRL